MAVSGSWLVPTLEGHPYLDKPAAFFAAVAVSLRVFGTNEWGARIPSAICGLQILAFVYAVTRRHYDRATAALAVIVVATSPMVFAFSRIVIMDSALALCTVAAILAAFVAEAGDVPDRRWHAAGAAAAGLGMLVKGPVGVLVPAAVLAVFFVVDRRPRALRRVFAPWNMLIVLGIFLPWFVGLCYAHPEFLHYGLVEETLNRFFRSTFNRGQPFWFFGPVLLEAFAPWTLLAVPMAFAAVSPRARLTSADRLFIVWAIVVLVFFSLSRTKQPGYILSGVVAAGVCVGRGLGYAWRNPAGRAARLVAVAALALAGLALILAGGQAWMVVRASMDTAHLADASTKQRLFGALWPWLAIVLAVVFLLGAAAYRSRRTGLAVAAFAALPLALVTVMLPGLDAVARARSAKPLADSLASLPADTEIACLDGYPAGLSFYLGRTLTILSEDGMPLRSNFILYWLRRVPVRPSTVVAPGGWDAWLASRTTDAIVLAPDSAHVDLDSWLGSRAPVRAVAAGWWGVSVPRPAGR
jgi:4-amino-4-deoxy-L-arabinose transferase-like glycosyltransferase